jgi:hemoglobin
MSAKETLLNKLGGEEAVNAAVDIFYKKILADDTVNGFFKHTDMHAQASKQKAFMMMVFGGPDEYKGKNMRDAHAGMKLTEAHFNAVAGHLKSTLEELNVPQEVQTEVMATVASTHDDVLNL